MKWRWLVPMTIAAVVFAQQPITFQYFYDDLGQLIKVVDSGIAIDYIYDPVGNMLEIKRSTVTPGALTVFNITPQQAGTGTKVFIQGLGFSTTASQNTVLFNGIAATVVAATATSLTVLIPAGATTGPVSVTVGGNTASSPANFVVVPLPMITSVNPKAMLAGTTVTTFSVTGVNLANSTFAFPPMFVPAKVNVSAVSIAADGKSATMTLIIDPSAMGRSTLVATSPAGPSDATPLVGFLPGTPVFNTVSIPGADPNADPDGDTLTNAKEIALGTDPLNLDTDGDGWPDGLEVLLKSNPLDPKSVPNPSASGYLASATFSILNNVAPVGSLGKQYVSGLTFSVLNNLNPSIGMAGSKQYVSGLTFSLLNNLNPSIGITGSKQYVSGLTFSLLNNLNPSLGMTGSKQYVSGLTFSLLNNLKPSIGMTGSKQYVSGLTFSLLNNLNPSIGMTGSKQYVSGLTFSLLNRISPAPLTPSQQFVNSLSFSILNGSSALHSGLLTSLFGGGGVAERVARPWAFPKDPRSVLDSDGDGISDEDEIRIGTNPYDADTDHDGYPDGLEIALGSDPLDPKSIPNIKRPVFVVSMDVSIQNYICKPGKSRRSSRRN